jgi:aminoglycoside phosphotransferase
MQILSLKESADIADEADRLCRIIEENADSLRDGSSGKETRLGEASFRLLQTGRNAVYRIDSRSTWFLKLPRGKNWSGIEGEALGFRFIKENFANNKYYYHPASVRISRDKGYILVSGIPGSQLNYELYRGIFRPSKSSVEHLKEMFYCCGHSLGALHKAGKDFEARPIRSGLPNTLQGRLEKAGEKLDLTGEKIAEWYERNAPFDSKDTFIHGNCTYRNILVQGSTVSILDFETCGRGARYNDLARMCSDIILCRTALVFPWKYAYTMLSAFLQGYREVYPYDPDSIFNYVALYVFDRYVQVYCIKKERESISGIPVVRSRLSRLLENLLQHDVDSVFVNVKL